MSEVKFDRVDPVRDNPFYDPDCKYISTFEKEGPLSSSRSFMEYWDSVVVYNKKNMSPEDFKGWFEEAIEHSDAW